MNSRFIVDLDSPKLKLHEFLRNELQKEIGNPNIKLDTFVISVTSFKDFVGVHGQHLTITDLNRINTSSSNPQTRAYPTDYALKKCSKSSTLEK